MSSHRDMARHLKTGSMSALMVQRYIV